ncbi:MAG: response regulator [Deltaproteobacteria bacterium]|nr:MAG: response regulator [Deltaproteobacteria bacterium]
MDEQPIKLLLVDDQETDAVLTRRMLKKNPGNRAEFQIHHCRDLTDTLAFLASEKPDVVLLDLGLPESQGLNTLEQVLEAAPNLPIVVLTGLPDEELGVKAVQTGAQDYLVKGQVNLDGLVRSLRYAIERKQMLIQLQEALSQVKILKGLLPICAHCKAIRDGHGDWRQLESYISEHSEAKFSHGLCPICFKELYPEYCKDK